VPSLSLLFPSKVLLSFHLFQVFDIWDTDGDLWLSRAEFEQLVQQIFKVDTSFQLALDTKYQYPSFPILMQNVDDIVSFRFAILLSDYLLSTTYSGLYFHFALKFRTFF